MYELRIACLVPNTRFNLSKLGYLHSLDEIPLPIDSSGREKHRERIGTEHSSHR